MRWLLDLFPSWRRSRSRRRGKRVPTLPTLGITNLEARRVLDGEFSISGAAAVSEGTTAAYQITMTGLVAEGQSTAVDVSLTNGGADDQDHGDLVTALQDAVTAYSGPGEVAFDSGTGVLTYTGGTGGTTMAPLAFSLDAADDNLVEGPEDFTIVLSVPDNGLSSVTTTIADSDTATWSLAGDTSMTESGPGSADYTVSLAGVLQEGETASIDLSLADGGTSGADYLDFAAAVSSAAGGYAGPGTLSFNSDTGVLTYTGGAGGTAMAPLTISLAAVDDSLAEGAEDYTVSLTNPGSTTGAGVAGGGSVTTTITDNDTAAWSLTGDTSVTESGPGAAEYTVSLSGVLQEGETASIVLSLADGGTSGADYLDFAAAVNSAASGYAGPGTVSFNSDTGVLTYTGGAGGTAMAPLTIRLAAVDDSFVEGGEDYTVSLANPGSTTGASVAGSGSVTTTITDSDTATWSLTGDTNMTESGPGAAEYTVSLSGVLQEGETASIVLSLADGGTSGADYLDFAAAVNSAASGYAGPGTVSFNSDTGVLTYTGGAGGTAMAPLTIRLAAVDDSFVEGGEDYTVSLANPGSTTGASVAGSGSVTTTITDNDTLTVEFNQSTGNDVESGGGNLPQLLVTGEVQQGHSVTVSVSVAGSSTASGGGVDFHSPTTLTITGGSYAATAFVIPTLAIVDDGTAEPDETIVLNNITGGGVTVGDTNGDAVTQASTTYTIEDDDALTVSIRATDADAREQNTNIGQFEVSIDGNRTAPAGGVTISYQITGTATNGTDYLTLNGTVTIFHKTETIIVIPWDDQIVEDGGETVVLTLTGTNKVGVKVNENNDTAAVTIADNDATTVSITATDASASETGANPGQFTVTLNNNKVAPDGGVTVYYSVGGSATNTDDYQTLSGSVTIAAGQRTAAINLVPIDDPVVEPATETVVLTLTGTDKASVTVAAAPNYTASVTIADNDRLTVEFSPNSSDVESSGGNLPAVLVSGQVQAGHSVTVNLAVGGGSTATGGGLDYTAPTALTINGGSYDGQAIAIPGLAVVNDSRVEPAETIVLTNLTGTAVTVGDANGDQATSSSTTYTILDDDSVLVQFDTAGSSDAEASGGNLAVLRVTGEIQAGYSVAVAVSVTGGTATSSDYTNTAAVTIGAGVYDGTAGTAVATNLAITDELLVEPDETLQLTLSTAAAQVTLGTTAATQYTILHDDQLIVEFDTASSSDAEAGGGNLPRLLVTGQVQAGYQVSIGVAVQGSSTATGGGTDFTNPAALTLTGGAYDGSAFAVPGLAIQDDNLVEPNETVVLNVGSSDDVAVGDANGDETVRGSTTYTILDDDTLLVQFDTASSSDTEASGGNLAVLLVTGEVQAGYSVSVSAAVTGGTATGADWTNTAAVTIGAGAYDGTSGTAVATNLAITNDALLEPDETIQLTLTTASPQVTLGTTAATQYTILDDDQLTVQFDTASSSDTEASGGNLAVLLVTGEVQAGYSVAVSVAVTGGTATSADYTNTAAVTIGAGVYDGTAGTAVATNLAITDESLVEPDETLQLTLTTNSPEVLLGTTTTTQYTILDDDQLTVQFDTASSSDAEAGGGNLAVLLVTGEVQAGYNVAVSVAVTGGTATSSDYTNAAAVTIGAGVYDGTAGTAVATNLAITDESLVEPDETLQLTLSTASSQVTLGTKATTQYTILNDDQLTVEFDTASSSDTEASGGNLAVLLVTGELQAGYSVSVSAAVTGGTATGADWTNTAAVTIGAGVYDGTAGTAVATNLAITNDALLEPDETIQLTLTGASPQVTLGATTTTQYTILDDDQLTVEFDTASSSDTEAGGGNLAVLLVTGEVQAGYSVAVSVAVTGGSASGADYTNTAAVTIGAGAYDGTAGTAVATQLAIMDESLVEPDETLQLTLATNSPEVLLGTTTTTQYTIRNDDRLTVEFDTASSSAAEASGGNLPQLLVTGQVQAGYQVTVNVAVDGSTTASGGGIDFGDPAVLTIGGGEYDSSVFAVPGLTIRDDSLVEPDETVVLDVVAGQLVAVGDANGDEDVVGGTTYTILDDDHVLVEFDTVSSGDAEASGGNLAVLLVTGEIQAGYSVTVSTTVTGGTATGADWTNTAAVTIGGGVYDGSVGTAVATQLAITDDSLVEPDETVELTLTTASMQVALGATDRTRYAILDDDRLTVEFNTANSSDAEASGGNLAVLLVTGEVQAGYSVTVSAAVTGGTASGADWTNTAAVTIGGGVYDGSPGTAVATHLAITDDAVVEPVETIGLTLTTASSQVTLGATVATQYTILDDDQLVVFFDQLSSGDWEASGGNLAVLWVTGEVQAGYSVAVAVTVTGGTATSTDWTNTPTVAIGGGVYDGTNGTAVATGLTITDDSMVEPDETISLTLTTESSQVVVGEINHTAYLIVNEDTATVTIGGAEQFEGTGGGQTEFTFTITLDNDVQDGFKLNFATVDETALHAGGILEQDYWDGQGQLVFTGVQGEVQTVTIPVAADAWIEQNETFQLQLGNLLDIDPTAADDIRVPTVSVGLILNDDVVPPQFFTPEAQAPTPLPTFVGLPEAPLASRTQMVFLESPDWGRGGAEASRVEEDVVELRLVVPRGDGQFEEQPVVRLPVDQLGRIRELLGRLPDDRYRFYYLRRDGASWLIIDVMLRDGKPVDPADVEPSQPVPAEPHASPLVPRADAPEPAPDGTTLRIDASSPSLASFAPASASPAIPTALSEPAEAGRPWKTRQALASGAALAACLPWSEWQQRVHAALAQRPRRPGGLRPRQTPADRSQDRSTRPTSGATA